MVITYRSSSRCKHHNFIKVKALLVISRQTRGITAGEISWQGNINLKSLRVLIIRWVRWGFVSRQRASWFKGQEDDKRWLYYLTAKGRDYIKRLPDWYPYLSDAVQEIDRLAKLHDGIAWYDGKQYHVITPPFTSKEDYLVTTDNPGIMQVRGPNYLFDALVHIQKRNYQPEFRDYVINSILETMPRG